MKMRVAVYNCTKSREVNDMQVALLTELAESMHEWKFSASKDVFFDVGASKVGIEGRPALEEVISRAKNGEYDLIVAKSFCSLVRNKDVLMELVDELLEHGVGFCFLDNQITTLEADNYFMLRVMAQDEEAARIKAGSNDCRILGYDKVSTESGVRYELNMEQVLLVAQIYGRTLEGASLQGIKFGLEFAGCLNAMGEEDWSLDMIREILRNPIYKGESNDGITVLPIIGTEMWELVQKISL